MIYYEKHDGKCIALSDMVFQGACDICGKTLDVSFYDVAELLENDETFDIDESPVYCKDCASKCMSRCFE